MPVVLHADVPCESVPGGATYQTLVGDSQGSTAIRIGIQTSPPGYRTFLHSHPYMQVITVLEGRGEAWMQDFDRLIALTPGVTLVIPANVQHWFGASGSEPLKVYGVPAAPHRIVHLYQEVGDDGASELPDNPHRVSRLPMSASGTGLPVRDVRGYGESWRMSGLATARGCGTPYALQFSANASVRWALRRVGAASASELATGAGRGRASSSSCSGGPRSTCARRSCGRSGRFWRLSRAGTFEAFFDALAAMSETAHLVQMFDSTVVRAHVSAGGGSQPQHAATVHDQPSWRR
jgi:quercetin dioxygenase-like cupin family protein